MAKGAKKCLSGVLGCEGSKTLSEAGLLSLGLQKDFARVAFHG